jgi:hypothetical protein
MWEHRSVSSFGVADVWLYMYADGRLVSQTWDSSESGWLEQRLTPEGVELIRSAIIASGVLDPDRSDRGGGQYVQVRDGDRLVFISGSEMRQRLSELWSWLPSHAWEDSEAKAFVPSRYAICMPEASGVFPIDPTNHMWLLPVAAREQLASADQLLTSEMVVADPALALPDWGFEEGSSAYCFTVTTAEARTLARVLDGAGLESSGPPGTWELPQPADDNEPERWLVLLPMLPHGVPAFVGG